MTIARRLTLLFAMPLIVLGGLGVLIADQIARVEGLTRFIVDKQLPSLAVLRDISRNASEVRVSARNRLLAKSEADRRGPEALFHQKEAELDRLLIHYADHLISNDKDRRLYTEYRQLTHDWSAKCKELMALAAGGRGDEAINLFLTGSIPALTSRSIEALGEWTEHNQALVAGAGNSTLSAVRDTRRNLLVALGAAILLSIVMGILTFRRIVRTIRGLQTSVESIAGGDYGHAVPFTEATDETGA